MKQCDIQKLTYVEELGIETVYVFPVRQPNGLLP